MERQLAISHAIGPTGTPLLQDTIGGVLDRITERFGDLEALVVRHQNIRWTYQEYRDEIDQFAAALLRLGVSKGDRVGIWAPNCVEWSLTQFATARIGAILVCINPAYRLHELEYALNKVQCKVLVSAEQFKTSRYLEMLQSLVPELEHCAPGELASEKLPHLKTVIRTGTAASPGMLNFPDLCCTPTQQELAHLQERMQSLQPTDPINIQFTSGTTGSPKGATLTHINILNNGHIIGEGMRLSEQDRLCIPVPLYHCFGMVLGNLACITHGATAVFPDLAFDPVTTLATVAAEKCTALHGVPTMFIAELDLPNFSDFDLSTLRTGIMAGAPCPVEVMKRVMKAMHMQEILIAYGQTECSPVNCMTAADDALDKRVSTVGATGPHLEIKITDEGGEPVEIGVQGEICCRGYAVMQGYWDSPEQTADTIDPEGWLHSGDLGVMDGEGYIKVTGRMKDMVIRGGENIYPREIEEFLYAHPDIAEVQVFGVPDQKFGEQVCAWIQVRDGASLTAEQVYAFCDGQIAKFKVPRYIQFVSEYPMTVTGKPQKFKMRELASKQLNLQEQGVARAT